MRRLQRGIKHDQAGEHREAEHELHDHDQLVGHRLHLRDHRGGVDHGEVGELADQPGGEVVARRRQVEAGDQRRGEILQHAGRGDEEEVHPHRVPVELAHAGDRRLDAAAADLERHTVAHREPEGLRQPRLDGELRLRRSRVPAPGLDDVARRQLGAVGQVELALGQAPRALVLVRRRVDRLAVDRHHAAADHRLDGRHRQALGREQRGDARALVGLDVDHEAVGRVGRRHPPPVVEEVGAHQGEQQQRGHAQAQRGGLDHAAAHAAAERGDAVAPAATAQAALALEPPGEPEHAPGGEREHAERHRKARRHHGAEARVGGDPEDQAEQRRQPEPPGRARDRLGKLELAPQHAQGADLAQAQQLRQHEAGEQRHADHQAMGERQRRGRGELGGEQLAQATRQPPLHRPAERGPEQRGSQPEEQELADHDAQHLRLTGSKHAHHRAAVEVARHEAARRQAHRHRGEDHREQCGQAQEALCLVERGAHLGAGVIHRLDTLAAAQVGARPFLVGLHRLRRSGHVQPPGGAAALGDQAGGVEVLQVEDRARQQAEEVGAAVGLEADHGADAELELAQAHLVAGLHAQLGEQALVQPHLARRRRTARGSVGLVGARRQTDGAAQRVAVLHHLDATERRALGGARHAGEQHRLRGLQAAAARLVDEAVGPRLVGAQQQVAAEQLVGLAVERAPDAVGEKAHAGQAGHRDHDRQPEQVQLARTQVAQHHAQGETQVSHHAADLSAPRPAGAAPARTSRPRPPAAPRR